jgi:hypothetical protein
MTERIFGRFSSIDQANAALAELTESGIRDFSIRVDESGTLITIEAPTEKGLFLRSIIEHHGGSTQVDEISDPGAIPEDPMGYSDDSAGP